MQEIECYWFFDGQQNDEDAVAKPLCMNCHKQPNMLNLGWYYKGPCGEWDLQCVACGKNIKTREEIVT